MEGVERKDQGRGPEIQQGLGEDGLGRGIRKAWTVDQGRGRMTYEVAKPIGQ